jgi:hypothetical protein
MSRFYSGFQDGRPKKKTNTPRPTPPVSRRERRRSWFDQLHTARHMAPLGTRGRYRLGLNPFGQAPRTVLEMPEREAYGSLDPTYKGRRNTYNVKRNFFFVAKGNRQGARQDWATKRKVMLVLRSLEKRGKAMDMVPVGERGRQWKQELRFLRYLAKDLKPAPTHTHNSEGDAK